MAIWQDKIQLVDSLVTTTVLQVESKRFQLERCHNRDMVNKQPLHSLDIVNKSNLRSAYQIAYLSYEHDTLPP